MPLLLSCRFPRDLTVQCVQLFVFCCVYNSLYFSFEAVSCFVCGRQRMVVIRYCMICLVINVNTTQKKFRITYYYNLCTCDFKLPHLFCTWRKLYETFSTSWVTCGSTSTNFQDDVTAILEKSKIHIFSEIFRRVINFKISDLQTCSGIITE